MEIETHPSKQPRVWLSADDILQLADSPKIGSKEWTGINLLSRAGLKVKDELLTIKREHVTVDDQQAAIKFSSGGKRPTMRKCPIPESLAYTILAYDDGLVFDVTDRAVRLWITKHTGALADETGNEDWEKVSARDLRRSWADVLLADGVPPELVKQWGGWNHAEMFQEMFLSRHSMSSSLAEVSRSTIY